MTVESLSLLSLSCVVRPSPCALLGLFWSACQRKLYGASVCTSSVPPEGGSTRAAWRSCWTDALRPSSPTPITSYRTHTWSVTCVIWLHLLPHQGPQLHFLVTFSTQCQKCRDARGKKYIHICLFYRQSCSICLKEAHSLYSSRLWYCLYLSNLCRHCGGRSCSQSSVIGRELLQTTASYWLLSKVDNDSQNTIKFSK